MGICNRELDLLNFYRASELEGGLVLGRMAGCTRDPHLALELTRHSAEEVVHARLWTETLLAVGGRPRPTRDTYQSRYAAFIGPPTSLLHVLALTQVFERRVLRHFHAHLRRPGTHAAVRITLRRMIEEEKSHLSWVRCWLDRQAEGRGRQVEDLMRRFQEADAAIYEGLLHEFGWKGV